MSNQKNPSRRAFLSTVTAAVGVSALQPHKLAAERASIQPAKPAMTIQDVIDLIIEAVPGAPRDGSVDTVKTGDPSQQVTGIATTFLATYDVIERAAALGANFIITHEPTFYNHLDQVDWLQNDPVYLAKRRFIDDNNIVIWRFHDYWHMHRPDGIIMGVLEDLGWVDYADPEKLHLCTIPSMPLADLAGFFKEKLSIKHVQVIGDLDMPCRRVGLLVGASGGRSHITFLGNEDVDVIAVGEINEWETSEYVRDAISTGRNQAIIILGHANSEESGMRWLFDWLQPRIPDVPVAFVPAGDPFVVL